MNRAAQDDELPLPLLRRSAPRRASEAEDDAPPPRRGYRESDAGDRFRPASAGALMGTLAGMAGLGAVHALHAARIGSGIEHLAAASDIPQDAALPLAYLAAAAMGAVVGALFASLTRHLRRYIPLLLWAEVFFVSLSMLALAISTTYGRGLGVSMAPAILGATAVFAVLASLQLPLRRRA